MNNNIKDTTSLVFVKGKNLIDSSKIIFGSVASGTGEYGYYSYAAVTDFIPVVAGSYHLKLFNPGSGNNRILVFRIAGYDENKNYLWDDNNLDTADRTITGSTTRYLRICFAINGFQTISSLNSIKNAQPQLEQGSTATSYEPYVEKQIHIKNKNGVFEEFYNENSLNRENYSLGEQKIGTWFDGKPLYRKTIQVTNKSFVAGNNNIPHNIDDMKLCVKVEAVKNGTQILPYINLTSDNKINTATFVTGVDSTNVILRVANDSWGASNTWYFTLYYTKTTD